MAPLEAGDYFIIPSIGSTILKPPIEVDWQQNSQPKSAKFYVVRAKNQSKGNEDVLLYVQDFLYEDENSNDHLGKLPDAKKQGDYYLMPATPYVQYGDFNHGKKRFAVLQDMNNKVDQDQFLWATIQGNVDDWVKEMVTQFGAKDLASQVFQMGKSSSGQPLQSF